MNTHFDESLSVDTMMKVLEPLNLENPVQAIMRNGVIPKEVPATEYNAPNFDNGVYDVANVGRRIRNDFDAMRNLKRLSAERNSNSDDKDDE